jgi:hypothetical protein
MPSYVGMGRAVRCDGRLTAPLSVIYSDGSLRPLLPM